MRARNLKPSFFKNDILGTMPMAARLLFEGLWCMADREGRLEDRALRIKAEILPYDDVDVDDLLNQLQARKFIIRYAHGEDRYIQVVNFKRHQSPHLKEADSTIPAYDIPHVESISTGDMPPASTMQAPDSHHASPPESLNLNPDTGLLTADKAPAARARAVDLLAESVVDACYGKTFSEITDDERGRVNKALPQLRKVGALPVDVYQRAEEYRQRSPGFALTPQTLTKAWSDLEVHRDPSRASPSGRGGARNGRMNGVDWIRKINGANEDDRPGSNQADRGHRSDLPELPTG